MTSWNSYPKLYTLGHGALVELLSDEVIIEEKIDGSQFSFGMFDGVLKCKSKNVELDLDDPQGMFKQGVDVCKTLAPVLTPGWTYRGEYLQKPKHNVLAYSRTPAQHIILFDINTAEETYLDYEAKHAEAARLGLGVVPLYFRGRVTELSTIQGFLDRTSSLGGQKIEGVVIKNYSRFGKDGKALIGKFVSADFKEIHKGEWKKENPKGKDILQILGQQYRTPARWNKAEQYLKEAGLLTNSAADIGPLLRRVQEDIKEECYQEIMDQLFKWAWPDIARGVVAGLPQHYKEKLAEQQPLFAGAGVE